MILDGRNRYRGARKLNLSTADIPIRRFDPARESNPVDFVWDENVNRRHLNETQRGLAAATMETLRHGGNRKGPHATQRPPTRRELARRYGVGHGTMHAMSVVRDRGGPDLNEIARAGQISVRTAKIIAEMSPSMQKTVVERTADVPARD